MFGLLFISDNKRILKSLFYVIFIFEFGFVSFLVRFKLLSIVASWPVYTRSDCFTFFTKYSIDDKFKNWSLNLDQNKILKTYINNFLYLSWLCTLCCQFLKIVHFWLSLRYSLSFILSNLLRTMRFWVNLVRYVDSQQIEKRNFFKVFGNKKAKEPKQESQTWLTLHKNLNRRTKHG